MDILRGLVHRRLVPRWVQQHVWNREYAAGQWDSRGLHTPDDPIYEILTRYCANRDVCDIGSGHGNTITEMAPVYRSYTGVDISEVALQIAAKRAAEAGRHHVRFVQGFMHTYTPHGRPDVFLFRESLYYVSRQRSHSMKDLADFLQRYAAMLSEEGVIIASICNSDEKCADRVEAVIRQNFDILECRRTQRPPALLLVFQPICRCASV